MIYLVQVLLMIEWEVDLVELFMKEFEGWMVLLCTWRRQVLVETTRKKTVLDATCSSSVIESQLAIVKVLLNCLRCIVYTTYLSLMAGCRLTLVVITAWIHWLFLYLSELRLIRVLKDRFYSAVIDVTWGHIILVLTFLRGSIELNTSHILMLDLVLCLQLKIFVSVVSWGFMIWVYLIDRVQA